MKFRQIFLALLISVIFLPGGSFAGTAPAYSAAPEAVAAPEAAPNALKKKRNKGYKKPKKKKFLGIFKRKSSCDCPKH